MWQAVRFCEHRGDRKFVICTDSLRFLTALDNPGTVDPLLQQVMALCHTSKDLGSSFTWCPGNVGIEDNEGADAAAGNAVDSPQVNVIALRPDDVKLAAKSTIINAWPHMWNKQQSKLSAVKQSISKWQVAGECLSLIHI